MPTVDLTDRVALVTGAGSGIGRATAELLVAAGAHVLAADVAEEAEGVAAAMGATFVHLDVSDPAAWSALYGSLERLDLLHLNAGTYDIELGDITEVTVERYRRYLGVNVDGVFFGLRGAIPLLERSKGSVVVTSSVAGIVPLPTNPVYALTKFALIGFVRSAAEGLSTRGIRLNAVCPGAVATAIMGDDPHAWYDQHFVAALEPEDVAATVVELLTWDVTGEVVVHVAPRPPETMRFPGLPTN